MKICGAQRTGMCDAKIGTRYHYEFFILQRRILESNLIALPLLLL